MTSITSSSTAECAKSAAADSPLRLTTESESDSPGPGISQANYSSIHETAVALVKVASEQANLSAAHTPTRAAERADQIGNDRHELAVQRANAEQARRFADCSRAALMSLLLHTYQPYFLLDELGVIVQWNDAMAHWTGIASANALGAALPTIFAADSAGEIIAASLALREAGDLPSLHGEDPAFVLNGQFALRTGNSASRIVLLPVARIPGIVETVVGLVTPA